MTRNVDKLLDELMNEQFKEQRAQSIKDVIEYGRHLNRVRKEHPEVVSGEDIVNYLIKHGLPPSLGIEIMEEIKKP